ncbi:hypothetical protein FRC00_009909, partial [Tulasnella sp. 408]
VSMANKKDISLNQPITRSNAPNKVGNCPWTRRIIDSSGGADFLDDDRDHRKQFASSKISNEVQPAKINLM